MVRIAADVIDHVTASGQRAARANSVAAVLHVVEMGPAAIFPGRPTVFGAAARLNAPEHRRGDYLVDVAGHIAAAEILRVTTAALPFHEIRRIATFRITDGRAVLADGPPQERLLGMAAADVVADVA